MDKATTTPAPAQVISREPWIEVILGSSGRIALIDADDANKVSRFKWTAQKSRSTYYAVHCYEVKGVRYTVYLHKFVLGVQDRRMVDHRNLNGLDCRRENLRLAERWQNQANRRNHNGGSRFRGIRFCPDHCPARPFRAIIRCQGKTFYLGNHATEIEAALAYDEGARKHHGEFARLNFPNPGEQSAVILEGRAA